MIVCNTYGLRVSRAPTAAPWAARISRAKSSGGCKMPAPARGLDGERKSGGGPGQQFANFSYGISWDSGSRAISGAPSAIRRDIVIRSIIRAAQSDKMKTRPTRLFTFLRRSKAAIHDFFIRIFVRFWKPSNQWGPQRNPRRCCEPLDCLGNAIRQQRTARQGD